MSYISLHAHLLFSYDHKGTLFSFVIIRRAYPQMLREEKGISGAKHVFSLFGSGTVMCLTLAAGGCQANLIVYLIREYNVKSIDAAQISNVVSGCTSLFPVIGAIIADSSWAASPPSSSLLASLCCRFYHHDKPQGSPFLSLARVIVARMRKRKVLLSSRIEDYHYGNDGEPEMVPATPKKSFSFLNRAALKTDGDFKAHGSSANPWRLCTIQQVENLKTLVRVFPLWSSNIFLSTPIAIQSSLTILQALTMDRHLVNSHFKIPAGSMLVLVLISTCISLPLIDRFLSPICHKLIPQSPTPLQRLGLGHVLNIISMAVSALVEWKRLKTAQNSMVPMSALWLFPQLVLVGIGEAFHAPGQLQLFHQEFPVSLRSMATAVVAVIVGIAYYLGTALIDLVQRVTGWLPDDINRGRLGSVYWMVVVMVVLNFGYYLVCAKLYKLRI